MKKAELARSTPFSDFFRNASSHQKQRVYEAVLRRSTERQLSILAKTS
ncbi:hypothetical protein [Pseudomonas sp. NPDC007930]